MAEPKFAPGVVPGQRPGRAGGLREKNRQKRTQSLCEAALDLFLQAGIQATTVDEMTRAAGVAKGSFYRYFADKGQLVDALFHTLRLDVLGQLADCARGVAAASSGDELYAVYRVLAARMSQVLLAEPRLTRLYLQECRAPAKGATATIAALHAEMRDAVVAMTEVAKERGLLRDLPAGVVAVAVVGAIEALLMQHFAGFDLGTPAAGADALLRLVFEGLA
jgi:AcrR family transcriptional regulator